MIRSARSQTQVSDCKQSGNVSLAALEESSCCSRLGLGRQKEKGVCSVRDDELGLFLDDSSLSECRWRHLTCYITISGSPPHINSCTVKSIHSMQEPCRYNMACFLKAGPRTTHARKVNLYHCSSTYLVIPRQEILGSLYKPSMLKCNTNQ